jgi:hypothetical protein
VRYFLITLACCLAVGGQAVAQTVGAGRIQVLGRGSVERTPDHAVVQVGIADLLGRPATIGGRSLGDAAGPFGERLKEINRELRRPNRDT